LLISINKEAEFYQAHDVFLDNATGDYFNYKKDQEMWFPMGNVGLHYSKAAEMEGTEESLMMRTRIYNSRLSHHSSQHIITSKISERC
jgi:hypothetical protein